MRLRPWVFLALALAWTCSFAASVVASGRPTEVLDGYDVLARRVLSNGQLAYSEKAGPTLTRGPVYPLVLAGELVVARGNLALVRWMEGAMLLIAAAIAAKTVGEWLPPPAGLFSGLAVAFHPLLMYYTAKLGSETFAALLFAVAGYVALTRKVPRGVARSVAFGAVAGVAILTKSVFAVLLPVYVAVELVRERRWTPVVRNATIAVISAAVLVVPWVVRNASISGRVVGTQTLGWWNFWYDTQFDRSWQEETLRAGGAGEDVFSRFPWYQGHPYHLSAAADADQEQRLKEEALAWIRMHPREFVAKVGSNLLQFWSQAASKPLSRVAGILWLVQAIVCLVGTRALLRARAATLPAWSWPLAAAMCLGMAPVFALVRHSIVLVPAAALLAGPAIATLLRRQAVSSPGGQGGGDGREG